MEATAPSCCIDLGPVRKLDNVMQAMVLKSVGTALEWTDFADRQPGPGEIRVKVGAYGEAAV